MVKGPGIKIEYILIGVGIILSLSLFLASR